MEKLLITAVVEFYDQYLETNYKLQKIINRLEALIAILIIGIVVLLVS